MSFLCGLECSGLFCLRRKIGLKRSFPRIQHVCIELRQAPNHTITLLFFLFCNKEQTPSKALTMPLSPHPTCTFLNTLICQQYYQFLPWNQRDGAAFPPHELHTVYLTLLGSISSSRTKDNKADKPLSCSQP